MRRVSVRAYWVCIALSLLILCYRLLWLATETETGLETLELHWQNAICALVGHSRTPVPAQAPDDQAKFWLKEVGRVLPLQEGSAVVAMGAALVLDTPGPSYEYRRGDNLQRAGVVVADSVDIERISRSGNEFEPRCLETCLELAEKATALDRSNVEWWRLRALLLTRDTNDVYALAGENWPAILGECAKHDPDNALYDYLATRFYWASSAELRYSDSDWQLVVKDPEVFQRGVEAFERGQKKTVFAAGDVGFAAVAEMLRHANLPLVDQEKIVNSRGIVIRRQLLLAKLMRLQSARATATAATGDLVAALAMEQQNLRLSDQYTSAAPSNAYDNVAIAHRVVATSRMSIFANRHKELFKPHELEEIEALTKDARLARLVREQAGRDLAARKLMPPKSRTIAGISAKLVALWIVAQVPPLVVILLVTGLVASAVSCVSRKRDLPRSGLLIQFLSLAAACVFTVVFLGLAPSGIISNEAQAWILTTLVFLLPASLVAWAAWVWLRSRDFRFSLRGMLIASLILSMIIGWITLRRFDDPSFLELPFALTIPPRGWSDVDASTLENAVSPLGLTYWALVQWSAYNGPHVTMAAWAILTAILLHLKLRRKSVETETQAFAFRDYLSAQAWSFAKASLSLSALLLILYAWVAPTIVASTDQTFRQNMEFARRPNDFWSLVDEAIQSVRSTPERMKSLREAVEAGMSDVRVGVGS